MLLSNIKNQPFHSTGILTICFLYPKISSFPPLVPRLDMRSTLPVGQISQSSPCIEVRLSPFQSPDNSRFIPQSSTHHIEIYSSRNIITGLQPTKNTHKLRSLVPVTLLEPYGTRLCTITTQKTCCCDAVATLADIADSN